MEGGKEKRREERKSYIHKNVHRAKTHPIDHRRYGSSVVKDCSFSFYFENFLQCSVSLIIQTKSMQP